MIGLQPRVLVIGDSVTAGSLGVGYVPLLQDSFPDWTFVNAGVGGDTLSRVSLRTLTMIDGEHFDCLVISVGINDILLPLLRTRGPLHAMWVRWLHKRGSVPTTTPHDFRQLYHSLIHSIRACRGYHRVPIIVTTLSALTEHRHSLQNRLRIEYNRSIRAVAYEEVCLVADVGAVFDQRLSDNGSEMLLGVDSLPVIRHLFHTSDPRRASSMSSRRGLEFTIDGVHLNRVGAQIYHDTIAAVLPLVVDV